MTQNRILFIHDLRNEDGGYLCTHILATSLMVEKSTSIFLVDGLKENGILLKTSINKVLRRLQPKCPPNVSQAPIKTLHSTYYVSHEVIDSSLALLQTT